MRDTRTLALMALVGATLVFAIVAGGAIATLASGGLPNSIGGWQPPSPAGTTPEPSPSGSAAPESPPTASAASDVPAAEPSPTPSPVPPTATLPEPSPSPTLRPLEVQTPEAPAANGQYIEYEVQPGDILGRVALDFDVSVTQIVELNPDIDPDSLTVGEILLIPRN